MSTSSVTGRKQRDNGGFWSILLGVLVVAIVIITVLILLLNGVFGSNGKVGVDNKIEFKAYLYDQVSSVDYDDAVQYLDEKKNEYTGTNGEIEILLVRIEYFLNNGYLGSAIEAIQNAEIDNMVVEANDKIRFYDLASSVYYRANNHEKEEEYDELAGQIRKEILNEVEE